MKNNKPKTGVLLVNLGTPNSPKVRDVFYYLNEFLTDPRVLDYSWIKRQMLARAIIVPLRVRQSAKLYQQLWTPDGSPLLVHGKAVVHKLQQLLGSSFKVVLGMRYQNPSIMAALDELQQSDVKEIIVYPLFPQYSSATTGSVHQKVMECIESWQTIPQMTFVNSYADHPDFIDAIYEVGKKYTMASYDHILFSFHGLPERQIRRADKHGGCLRPGCCEAISSHNQFCYRAQCYATTRALVERFKFPPKSFTLCFQSRLGKEPWLQPYTLDVLRNCAKNGYKRLLVFCPSFVCDCLETTCEIMHEYGKEFKALGGESLQLVEGLNSHDAWIQALEKMIRKPRCRPEEGSQAVPA